MSQAPDAPQTKRKPSFGNAIGWRARRLHKHLNPRTRKPAPYGIAALCAWVAEPDFIGRRESMRRAFGARLPAWRTITDWECGRRQAPQWARDIVAAALREQIAARQHALALLEADSPKPNLIGTVRNPGDL